MSNESRARIPIGRRKFSVGDSAYVNDQAPADYRERTGIITEVGPGKSEYRIEFEDGQTPTTGYLMSSLLEKR